MPAEMPKPIEEPKQEQAPPSSRRGDFGHSGSKELSALEGMEKEARQEAEAAPGDQEKANELALAEKRLELFLNEHDNAGAFKFKRFGRDMMGMFEDSPDKPRAIEADKETGKLTLAESEKNRRLMFVNMGELDRINKEGGGHAAGDAALKETVHAIEAAILAKIGDKVGSKEGRYNMLRYRGNEFMVSFEDISKEDFEDIMQTVREARPKVDGVDDGAPLVADGFELQEALDIVNQLQTELGPDERIDPSEPGAAAREVIEVMRKRADYSLDVDKFISRVDRVREKLAGGDIAESRAFFDNYMKKMFQGTELQDLARFESLKPEEIEKMAFEFASKYLADAKSLEDAKRAIIDGRLKEIRGGDQETPRADLALGEHGVVPLAKVPERTRGQLTLDDLEGKAAAAEKAGSPNAEMLRLDAQIESAKRDRGTGLLERGVHYENLEKSFKEGKEAQMVFVDMGFLRYFDNKGGPEVGNDALKVAADMMEQAIEDSGVEGMAFRYGGDEFTVQIDGGPEQVAKFQQELAKLREKAGAIPVGKRGSADGYYPTELVFNYGTADTKIAEEVYESLKEAGKFTPDELADEDRVANAKAEIMTTIADKAIEEEKAINRFAMLVDALRDPAYKTDPGRKTQVENLIAFSNKALFAEAGGGTYLRSLAESGKDEQAIRAEVQQWVTERIKENHEKEGQKADLLSQLVEVHGKIRYYERALFEARHESAEAKSRNESLMSELVKVKAERQELIDVRKALE